ncbi:hypothetical protein [Anaplasma phagocytophilum]|uniref:Putative p44-76 outer membrane protein, silent n=1 Tax=Anaplasma phagocytophilum str. NCH-1 TaxID=1359161 RepID=A0A0F3MV23_ANAPH|nr:putative p44-76 outer membrane protein, silent [Anaplasma phagocytophilum str. NCH-1]
MEISNPNIDKKVCTGTHAKDARDSSGSPHHIRKSLAAETMIQRSVVVLVQSRRIIHLASLLGCWGYERERIGLLEDIMKAC